MNEGFQYYCFFFFKAVKQAKESGASIWIFPEGTRKTKCDFLSFLAVAVLMLFDVLPLLLLLLMNLLFF